MSKYEVNVWEYADEFKNLDTNETFYGYQVCELLEQKDQRIAELEAKLTESESKRKSLEEKVKFLTEETEENFIDGQKYNELKQQLHDLPKKIVEEVKDGLLDFSNGWWKYFMTDGCEYMLSSDLQGCLDEIIDTILKKYGVENE